MVDFVRIASELSHGQIGQDLWVLAMTGARTGGFFVEIGSTDGQELNNTCILERVFGWDGVCVEPQPAYFAKLEKNRSATKVNKAVWKTSGGQIEFLARGLLGSVTEVAFTDGHANARKLHLETKGSIAVETISPNDLFAGAKVPPVFDYFSLDVEGAETVVLENLDLSRWKFCLTTIEHNGNKQTYETARRLLEPLGYKRVDMRFEDWFYHPELLDARNAARIDYAAVSDRFRNFVTPDVKTPAV